MANSREPHVLLFPFPAQGHSRPFLKLAELFSIAGLRITFVDTEFNHSRILSSSPSVIARLAARPLFRFCTIPDGLPDDNPRSFLQFQNISWSLLEPKPQGAFKGLVAGGDGWPPVSCAIVDALVFAFIDSALDMGIPVMMVRTSSACSTLAYHCLPALVKSGEVPFSADGADLDEKIQSVPGMQSFLRRRDLPSFFRNLKSTDDPMFHFLTRIIINNTKVRGLILNTVESFDSSVLSQLVTQDFPTAFAIGPFHTLLQEFNNYDGYDQKVSNSASLWEEDNSCISWLDMQPHKSVIYASFGSITVLSKEKLIEFWYGLAKSGYPFLWVMRKDLLESKHDTEQEIPAELMELTRKRGYIVEWAPQEEVLMHQAVGCFLTHSGWNSTLESIIAGVPMICWPFFADQQITSRFVSEVWKIGVDMKDTCDRNVMDRLIREVMEGSKSVEIRSSVEKMAEIARISVRKGGSSYENFKKLIEKIKVMSSEYYTKITVASDAGL